MPGNGSFYRRNEARLYEMRSSMDPVFTASHPQRPSTWDIFLSYTRRDLAVAREFANYLSRQGNDVYFDDWDDNVEGDTPGLVDHIREELEKSRQLAVLLTENCQLSWWVPLEVGVSMEAKNSRDHITAYCEGRVAVPSYFSRTRPLPDLCR